MRYITKDFMETYLREKEQFENRRGELIARVIADYTENHIGSSTLAMEVQTTPVTITRWLRESGVAIQGPGGRVRMPLYGSVIEATAHTEPAYTFAWDAPEDSGSIKYKGEPTVLVTCSDGRAVHVFCDRTSFDTTVPTETKPLGWALTTFDRRDEHLCNLFDAWVAENPSTPVE